MKKFSLLLSFAVSIFGMYTLWTGTLSALLTKLYENIDENLMLIEGILLAGVTIHSVAYTLYVGLEEIKLDLL